MIPILRLGDLGEGICRAGHPGIPIGQPFPMMTTIITGADTVFANFLPIAVVGSLGSTDCGHTTSAITGSDSVFVENIPVHKIGDNGVVEDPGGGEYTAITGSDDIFAG